MRALLERAGFVIRSTSIATCAFCGSGGSGRNNRTVSYTDEVWHCFRCGAKGNIQSLAKKLGLLSNKRMTRPERFTTNKERRSASGAAAYRASYRAWLLRQESEAAHALWLLSWKARRAARFLRRSGAARQKANDDAWSVMARFHDAEARLSARLDFITSEPASRWLDGGSSSKRAVVEEFKTGKAQMNA